MSDGFGMTIGMAEETVAGTPEATVDLFFPAEDFKMDQKAEHIERKGSMGVIGKLASLPGKKTPFCDLTTELLASLPHPFYQVLGATSAAQQGVTAAYLHTITIPTDLVLPSFTIEGDQGFRNGKQAGCVLDKLALSCAAGEAAKLKLSYLGLTHDANPTLTSVPAYVTDVLTFVGAKATIAGADSTTLENIELTIDNQLESKHVLNQQTTPGVVRRKSRPVVSGKAVFIDYDADEYTKLHAATTFALVLVFEGDTISAPYKKKVEITLPCCQWTEGWDPTTKPEAINGEAGFEAFWDSVTSKLISVAATNTLTDLEGGGLS